MLDLLLCAESACFYIRPLIGIVRQFESIKLTLYVTDILKNTICLILKNFSYLKAFEVYESKSKTISLAEPNARKWRY